MPCAQDRDLRAGSNDTEGLELAVAKCVSPSPWWACARLSFNPGSFPGTQPSHSPSGSAGFSAALHIITVTRGLAVLERAFGDEAQLRKIAAHTIDLVLGKAGG
jgi:hypothetical protein